MSQLPDLSLWVSPIGLPKAPVLCLKQELVIKMGLAQQSQVLLMHAGAVLEDIEPATEDDLPPLEVQALVRPAISTRTYQNGRIAFEDEMTRRLHAAQQHLTRDEGGDVWRLSSDARIEFHDWSSHVYIVGMTQWQIETLLSVVETFTWEYHHHRRIWRAFEPEGVGELRLDLGGSVIVTHDSGPGTCIHRWVFGENADTRQIGWFPFSHTAPIDVDRVSEDGESESSNS